ncbi:hypothetical protein E2C01_011880 [Portunus trituberculatus]|uniref:Uncharacterized protein n=1 Tax=Portunus trituberculatus TaxID=210409 RepID=A0A5B7DCM8_PORTR|nr:hypothetical protein [Portunus trituberculatus]
MDALHCNVHSLMLFCICKIRCISQTGYTIYNVASCGLFTKQNFCTAVRKSDAGLENLAEHTADHVNSTPVPPRASLLCPNSFLPSQVVVMVVGVAASMVLSHREEEWCK